MLRSPSTFSLVALAGLAFTLVAAPVALATVSHLPSWGPLAIAAAAVLGLMLVPSAQRD
ncbi:MAG: hypothetical protein QM723_37505 [Myxococcaceae bacterium]